MLAGMLCMLLIGLPIGLLIGALILRGAASLANRCVGSADRPYYGDDEDWEDYPRSRKKRHRRFAGIPEPEIGRGMLIMLVIFIVNAAVSYGIRQVVGPVVVNAGAGPFPRGQVLSQLFGLPIGFLVLSSMLTVMLPTSFPRACLVSLFYYVICILIAVAIFVPLFALGLAMRA